MNCHFVWCVKYRNKLLAGDVAERLKELVRERAERLTADIAGLEVMPDHVHLFISAPPTDATQFYANKFTGYMSRVLRQEFVHLRTQPSSLWSRSYYVGSAGHVSADIIQRYIDNQKERE